MSTINNYFDMPKLYDGEFRKFCKRCILLDETQFRRKLKKYSDRDSCDMDYLAHRLALSKLFKLLQIIILENNYNVNNEYIGAVYHHYELETLQFLIDNGLDILKYDETILYCMERSSIESIQLLIDYGLDLSKYEKDGILARSCRRSNPCVTKMLLNCGIDINALNGKALLTACECENINIVELLLESGANPNLNNGQELYLSISSNNKTLAQLLFQYGADINLLNKYLLKTINISEFDQLILDHGLDPTVLLLIRDHHYDKFITTK
jgi:hypothetical protein